jgi:hypothetical protein
VSAFCISIALVSALLRCQHCSGVNTILVSALLWYQQCSGISKSLVNKTGEQKEKSQVMEAIRLTRNEHHRKVRVHISNWLVNTDVQKGSWQQSPPGAFPKGPIGSPVDVVGLWRGDSSKKGPSGLKTEPIVKSWQT